MRVAMRGPAARSAAQALRCSAPRARPYPAAPRRPCAAGSLPFGHAAPAATAHAAAARAASAEAARGATSEAVIVSGGVCGDASSRMPPLRPPGPAELQPEDMKWLYSTRLQRLIFAAWAVLEVALLVKAATSPGALAALAAAPAQTAVCMTLLVAAAWLVADLVVGVIHWAVDNYGDADTAVMGHVIAAFQSHHERPWLITRGQFCTVVEGPCVTQLPLQAAALAVVASPAALLFTAAFAAMTVTAQLAHAWSHTNRAVLPTCVRALQDSGILISTKEHREHHTAPIADHYCILSGFWNGALDGSGVLVAAERALHAFTGVKPRSWESGDAPKPKPSRR